MAKHITSEHLEGATPVPSPITSPAPTRKKARARKADLKTSVASSPGETAPDYTALGLDDDRARQAERLRLESLELGRKSTAGVFEWGRIAAELHDLADDQKHFAKLAKGVLGLSRTGAENYERVHTHLAPHKERMVRVGMIASGLYDLATADPAQVEEVMAVREAGQGLTGAQIKAMLGKGGTTAASPDDGGPGGLKAAVAEKTAFATKLFFDTLFHMLRDVHVALEPHRGGGQVVKAKATAALMHPARLAGGLIESLTYAAQIRPERVADGTVHVMPVSENGWASLRRVLYTMGSTETWPKAEAVGTWLAETVLPQFEWALGSDRAEKARVVIEENAAAAEAERVNAEKAKDRAKAEQKKARDKAKREKQMADKRAARESTTAAKLSAAMGSVMAEIASAAPSTSSDA